MNTRTATSLIRRATREDADTITRLTDAAYAPYIPLIGRRPQPMTADYHQMVAEHPIWLLTLDNEAAGVLVLIHHPDHLLIYSVAIVPPYQRQGWGRELLAWAEEQARGAGYELVRLYTNERFTRNIALYRHLGYQETGREPLLGSTVVHMAKKLAT